MKKFSLILVFTTILCTLLFVGSTLICPMQLHGPDYWIQKTKTQVRALNSAVNLYREDNQSYPQSLDGDRVVGNYLNRWPVDVFGQEYIYRLAEDKQSFMIYSLGRNGVDEFGEGDDVGRLDKKYGCPEYYRCKTSCEKSQAFTLVAAVILWPIALIYLAGSGVLYIYRKYKKSSRSG